MLRPSFTSILKGLFPLYTTSLRLLLSAVIILQPQDVLAYQPLEYGP